MNSKIVTATIPAIPSEKPTVGMMIGALLLLRNDIKRGAIIPDGAENEGQLDLFKTSYTYWLELIALDLEGRLLGEPMQNGIGARETMESKKNLKDVRQSLINYILRLTESELPDRAVAAAQVETLPAVIGSLMALDRHIQRTGKPA